MQNTMECMEKNDRKILQKFDKEISQTFVLNMMKKENEGLKVKLRQMISQYCFYQPVGRQVLTFLIFHFTFYILHLSLPQLITSKQVT